MNPCGRRRTGTPVDPKCGSVIRDRVMRVRARCQKYGACGRERSEYPDRSRETLAVETRYLITPLIGFAEAALPVGGMPKTFSIVRKTL